MAIPVIFDTNAYRALTYGKNINEVISLIKEIRRKEALQNIVAFVCPIVWAELFCHLYDYEDKAFDNCYCALIASYFHSLEDEKTDRYRLIGDGDDLLAGSLFNYVNPDNENRYRGFAQLILEMYNNPKWKNEDKYATCFKNVKAATDKDEINFLNTFKKVAESYAIRKESLKKMLSNLRSEQLFNTIAGHQVQKALITAKKSISDFTQAELEKHTEFVKNYFPAPLCLSINIVEKLIGQSNFDITKDNRHNWVWDYQLLFSISKYHANILITDDKAMLDAAKAAHLGDKIMKLADYKLRLGI